MKKKYNTPKIKKIIKITTKPLLYGSAVEKAEVKSMGQEVIEYDFTADGFNTEWE